MEKSLGAHIRGWRFLRLFFVGWLGLTLISIDALWPPGLLGLVLAVSVIAMILAAAAASRGNKLLGALSLGVAGLVFFALLLIQIASRSVPQSIPVTLMQFVMLLFAVEIFTAIGRRVSQFSSELLEEETVYSISALQRSLQQAFRRLSRSGIVLGTGYVASLGALFLGTLAPVPSLLGDISLYIVVVSIALALLLVVREDQTKSERKRLSMPEDRRWYD